jgi:RNase P/RNase MRP subunit p29
MKLREKASSPRLIGRNAGVVSSKNQSLIGLSGVIVDETRNTIVINVHGRDKRVMKGAVVLEIGGERIDGKKLLRRPEES